MGDAIGPFERGHLLALAFQGLNANNMTYSIVKENGKTGTVGTVVESIVGRAIEDKVIKVLEKLPSGYKVYTTSDMPLWNAYVACGMLAAIMVNCGAARSGVPSTSCITTICSSTRQACLVDAVPWACPSVCPSATDLRRGGPSFHGNHVDEDVKGTVIPQRSGLCIDAGTRCSLRSQPPIGEGCLGDIPEFKAPIKGR
jgi:methyl-coenzyme M reductase beta subunit